MLQVQRLAILWSSTIFFLIISPVLAIYALGYDFDIQKNNLKNTITASVETSPDNATISVASRVSKQSFTSNLDFRIPSEGQIGLEISKSGFATEKFLIKGRSESNSLVRLKKIHLLPQENQILADINPEAKNISFISKDYLLFSLRNGIDGKQPDQTRWYIQQYSYNGFLGEPRLVSVYNTNSESQPSTGNTDSGIILSGGLNSVSLNSDKDLKIIPTNSFWEEVDRDSFWQNDTQSLLLKDSLGNWKLWQSQLLDLGELDTIWLSQGAVLLHDKLKSKNLYLYDILLDRLIYLSDNINAISFNNGVLWVWRENKFYQFSKNDINSIATLDWSKLSGFSLNSFESLRLADLDGSNPKFKVKNVYQGIIALINNKIFYLPDSLPDKWILIATNVQHWTSTWHSLFWITSDNLLLTHNLEMGYRRYVANLSDDLKDQDVLNLDYYANWHRVFLFTRDSNNSESEQKIKSIWYNPDFVNNEIRTFSKVDWINQPVCRSFLDNGYLFCVNENKKLISYRNLH